MKFSDVPNYESRVALVAAILKTNSPKPWLVAPNQRSWTAVARELNTTNNAVRKQWNRLWQYFGGRYEAFEPFLEHVRILAGVITPPSSQINTPVVAEDSVNIAEEYLLNMGYDPNDFEVIPKSVWGTSQTPQASFTVVRKPPSPEEINSLVAKIANAVKTRVTKIHDYYSVDTATVFSLYDPHIGKLAYQAGGGVTDMAATYRQVLTELIDASTAYCEGKAVLVVGQDMLNFDNVNGTTTAGTPQSNIMNWQDAIAVQSELVVWAVNQLRETYHRVEIHLVPGNHDEYSNFWLYKLLQYAYQDAHDVGIVGGKRWSIMEHGQVGVFFIHGDKGRPPNYAQVWSVADPMSWAQTSYKEVHTGHLHTRQELAYRLTEDKGIVTRYMPGLSVTDNWHDANLYVFNNRLGLATVYDVYYPIAEFYSHVK